MTKEQKKMKIKNYIRHFREEEDINKIIKDFIETEWAKEDDKGKAFSMFKGLIFSKDAKAKKFIDALDKLTSAMNAEDYK